MINTEDARQALKRPTVVIDGTRYEGKVLSYFEWLEWESHLVTWALGQLNADDAREQIKKFLIALGFNDDIAERILKLEAPIVEDILHDFIGLHRRKTPPAVASS